MMIVNIQMISLVTDLVPIVPVKTVDNAPANLLLAFPHRSLPGLEGKRFKLVKSRNKINRSLPGLEGQILDFVNLQMWEIGIHFSQNV